MAAPRCFVSGRFTTQLRIKMRLFLILKMSPGDRRKELTEMPCSGNDRSTSPSID